jgi:long-chain acyl-CoA synthetase
VFGMTAVMNASLAAGFEITLLPRFRLDELLKVIDRQRVTIMMGVPTMYSAINGSALLGQYDLSSLRYCVSGGAPLPRQVQETFERETGCSLVEGYGLTEAGPVCTINPFGAHRAGSVGLPLQGTVVEIASIDEPDRLLPQGQRGEICISGPQVMAGYGKQPGETADVLRGGRLYTGDVGYLDQDGYVYLIDRIKDLILCGGFNVYPRMVEEAIELHPAVEEVAVCGIPDRHRGEIVQAFVKLRDGEALSAAALRGFLMDKLAPFEQPKKIEFRDHLPKTFIGKPSRRSLIAQEMRRLNAGTSSQVEPAPLAHEVP